MTKKIRSVVLMLSVLGIAPTASAQLFLGVGAYGHHYSDLGLFPGIQARLGVEANEGRYTVEIGYNYSPVKVSRNAPFSYVNTSTGTSQQITHQLQVSVSSLTFHGAINLGNDDQDFRIGILSGISIDEYAVKYEKGSIPSGYKYTKESDIEDGSSAFWKVDVGIKGNYRLGNGAVYAEALVGLPVSEKNNKLILAGASTHYGVQLGYKFNLNNSRYAYRSRF